MATPDPLERLLTEAIPTGTFGHARPAPAPARRRETPAARWTPEEQAHHRAVLEAALDAIEPRGPAIPGRHLRVVDSDAA